MYTILNSLILYDSLIINILELVLMMMMLKKRTEN